MGLIKSFFSIFGVLSPVHIIWVKMTRGMKFVGEDAFGNRYFQAAPIKGYARPRRIVMYKGAPEASKVPPEWHGWLHHQTDVFPTLEGTEDGYRRNWQKPHEENKTGTDEAYMPPGHQLKGGKRAKATGDYEAWTPSE